MPARTGIFLGPSGYYQNDLATVQPQNNSLTPSDASSTTTGGTPTPAGSSPPPPAQPPPPQTSPAPVDNPNLTPTTDPAVLAARYPGLYSPSGNLPSPAGSGGLPGPPKYDPYGNPQNGPGYDPSAWMAAYNQALHDQHR